MPGWDSPCSGPTIVNDALPGISDSERADVRVARRLFSNRAMMLQRLGIGSASMAVLRGDVVIRNAEGLVGSTRTLRP